MSEAPLVGQAVWCIEAETCASRLLWLVEQGFEAISLNTTELVRDDADWENCAKIVQREGLVTTFHFGLGRVDQGLDLALLDRRLGEVERWHNEVGPVRNVTFDPLTRSPQGEGRPQMAYPETGEMLRRAHERLAPLGIAVGVENGWLREGTAEHLERIREHAFADLAMILDLGHANIHVHDAQFAQPIEEYIKSLPLPIIELHVHDNNGERDRHESLGSGTLDLAGAVRGLKAVGFAGVATIEVAPGLRGIPLERPERMMLIAWARRTFLDAWAGSPSAPT